MMLKAYDCIEIQKNSNKTNSLYGDKMFACTQNLTVYHCHSGFVPPRECSRGTNPLADTFHRNISASVGVPPRTFPHARIRSGPRKCSASVNVPNERVHFCLKALDMFTSIFTCIQSVRDLHSRTCTLEHHISPFPEQSLADWCCKNCQYNVLQSFDVLQHFTHL